MLPYVQDLRIFGGLGSMYTQLKIYRISSIQPQLYKVFFSFPIFLLFWLAPSEISQQWIGLVLLHHLLEGMVLGFQITVVWRSYKIPLLMYFLVLNFCLPYPTNYLDLQPSLCWKMLPKQKASSKFCSPLWV